MKKIYLFLLFLPLLSCNDWLDISPENSVTLTNYFGTKCPKAGFGEAPQQAFLQPAGMQK